MELGKPNRTYTLRGQLDPSTLNQRLLLFDGQFDTAFRIIEFEVSTSSPTTSSADVSMIISTDPCVTANNWDWSDNRQIAWAQYISQGGDSGVFPRSFVDPDNLVVQDLYISAFVASGQLGNYMITLEKYDINDWQGALAMVRNSAQSVGN
jgi:hypothetical protein